jgi:hypothetical protein
MKVRKQNPVHLTFRASTAEAAAIRLLGKRNRQTRSEVLRFAIREIAKAAGLWPPPKEQKIDIEA